MHGVSGTEDECAVDQVPPLAPPILVDRRLAKTADPEGKGGDGPEAEREQSDRRS